MENGKITRQHLVQTLRELLSDEYDADDLVELTDAELIQKIIDCAMFYKESWSGFEQ